MSAARAYEGRASNRLASGTEYVPRAHGEKKYTLPSRTASGDTPGSVEPENKNGMPLTLVSGMVGHNISCGIASSGVNVLGTMPGAMLPSGWTTQMLPRIASDTR